MLTVDIIGAVKFTADVLRCDNGWFIALFVVSGVPSNSNRNYLWHVVFGIGILDTSVLDN